MNLACTIIAPALLIGIPIISAETDDSILHRHIERLQQEGKYKKAIATILKVRETPDRDRFLSWKLAELYVLDRDYPKAIDVYLINLHHEPHRYAQVEGLLQSLVRGGQASQVIQLLKTAAEKADDPLPAALLTSSCALEAGDPQSGYDVLSRIIHRPQVPELLFQFASRCEARGHDLIAARSYAFFTDHSSDSPYVYQALLRQARIAERRRDFKQAVAIYQQLAGEFPSEPEAMEALLELGRLQLELVDDVEAARTSLHTVLEASGQGTWRAEALALLSECALRQDDLEGAAAHLERLRHLEPAFAHEADYKLAELSYFRGDFDAATELLKTLVQENLREDQANDALQLLLRIEEHGSHAEALGMLARGQLRERQKRHAEAEKAWAWLETRSPLGLRQLSLLLQARIRASQQQPEKALEIYSRLTVTYPRSPYVLDAQMDLARIYLEQNEIDRALKIFETALLSSPGDARSPEIRLQIQRLRRLQKERKTG